MKKSMLAQDALTLYAEKFITLENIAKQINVSERTLRRWKKADNWDDKKSRFIKNQTLFHEDLFKFGQTLLKSIKNDMALGKKIEPARLYAAFKIFNLLKAVKGYEEEIFKEKRKMHETKPKGLTPEIIKEIEESVLGITYKE